MNKFARVSQRLFNTPLMLRPEKAEMLCAALVDRLGIASLDTIDGTTLGAAQLRQRADMWAEETPKTARDMYEIEDGVATIQINGTLVHKLGGVEPYSGMIGYDCLDRILADARANKKVEAIMLDMDTPGGETSGCFEFAKKVYQGSARFGGKPIFGFANEMSCSAGYAIASACDRVAATETSVTGSIGVWTLLVDMTKALDKNGFKVTMIRAGERKARGGPYEEADSEVVAKLQSWVDETRAMFIKLVSTFRTIPAGKIEAQEADWYSGETGMEHGLVDAVATPDEIYAALMAAGSQYRAAQ